MAKKTAKRFSRARRSILAMSADEARRFLLKPESYFRVDLPAYFDFAPVLRSVQKVLGREPLEPGGMGRPDRFESVNYIIYSNKDGKYSWRPFQLVHPVLYVDLVNLLTEENVWGQIRQRFAEFAADPKVACLSLPQESLTKRRDQAEQTAQWWEGIEQTSLECSLEFPYAFHADIADCYSSIYTHSIAWALHEKDVAKAKKTDKALLGNAIDLRVRAMQNGQTNGVPQGSVLLDCVAELVLGYADLELSRRVSTSNVSPDFRILRYRDDYRIFSKTADVGETVLRILTELLMGLGLKLNTAKTAATETVAGAVKPDKLAWMRMRQRDPNLQKHLLLIHGHSREFPNAGSVRAALDEVYLRLGRRVRVQSPVQLISIVVDIGYNNPVAFSVCAAIVSRLLQRLPEGERVSVAERIRNRLRQFPNSGHFEVWLQRITDKVHPSLEYDDPLCKLVQGKNIALWNNDWLADASLKATMEKARVVNSKKRVAMHPEMSRKEFALFAPY